MLFVSADDAQMDVVERAGRLVAGIARARCSPTSWSSSGAPATALRVDRPALAGGSGGAPRSPSAIPRACRPASTRGGGSSGPGPLGGGGRQGGADADGARRTGGGARRPRRRRGGLSDRRRAPSPPCRCSSPCRWPTRRAVRYPAAVVDGPKRAAAERFLRVPARRRGRHRVHGRRVRRRRRYGRVDEPEPRSVSPPSRSPRRRWPCCWRCRWRWASAGCWPARRFAARRWSRPWCRCRWCCRRWRSACCCCSCWAGRGRSAGSSTAPASRWSSPGRRWCSPWSS